MEVPASAPVLLTERIGRPVDSAAEKEVPVSGPLAVESEQRRAAAELAACVRLAASSEPAAAMFEPKVARLRPGAPSRPDPVPARAAPTVE